jgi:hypothetical protein
MNKYILELYKEWAEKGMIPDQGLCLTELGRTESFWMIQPNDDEEIDESEFVKRLYWGFGEENYESNNDVVYTFTPLRQNLVLLIACLEQE